jgi:hydroxymethylpyrimidine/phosphomethylpyrimidine kinase
MISTSGARLLEIEATKAYLDQLLPFCTVLTPNLPEAVLLAKLAGEDYGPVEDLDLLRRVDLAKLLVRYCEWVLLKGGHCPVVQNGRNVVVDILIHKDGEVTEFVSEFSSSKNTHGTGCTLACTV